MIVAKIHSKLLSRETSNATPDFKRPVWASAYLSIRLKGEAWVGHAVEQDQAVVTSWQKLEPE